jgi:hypothetical protein
MFEVRENFSTPNLELRVIILRTTEKNYLH